MEVVTGSMTHALIVRHSAAVEVTLRSNQGWGCFQPR